MGSVNLDLVYRVAQLPRPGETVLGTDLVRLSGGKGGNQAHAAARVAGSGITVAMVACVGDDEVAGRLREDLARAGVDTAGMRSVPGPSGTALIAVDDGGENTIVVVPGANAVWPDEVIDDLAPAPGDVVVLQLEIPFPVVEAVVRRASAAGARIVLNAAPLDRRVAGLLPLLDVLVLNELEAAELFGLDGAVDEEILTGVVSGLTTDLVVTLGARGAMMVPAGGAVTTRPAYSVEAIDTVGAGDAFVGGFAAEWAAGGSLEDAVRVGSAAGALTTTVPGARHPGLDRAGVERLAGPFG